LISTGKCTLLPFLHLNPQAVSSLLIGLLEVTNGIKECALVDMSLEVKLTLVSFMIGFGGLSINAQVLSVIAGAKLKFGIYTVMKLFHGVAESIYTYLLFGVFGVKQVFNVFDSVNIKQYVRYLNTSFFDRIGDSTLNLSFVLLLMLLFAFIRNIKKVKA
jgi:hypothetical protein